MINKVLATALVLSAIGPMPAMSGDSDCYVPMTDWKPKAAVQKMIEDQGWTVRRIKIDNGCYEVYVFDSNGAEIEARVNPSTLEILSTEEENFFKRSDEKKDHKTDSENKVNDK